MGSYGKVIAVGTNDSIHGGDAEGDEADDGVKGEGEECH